MTNQKQAMLYGLGTVLLWSTVATAFKLSLRELTPVQMLVVACSASVIVMALILVAQRRWHLVFELSRRQYLQSFGMGLINPCLYYFLLFGAFDRLPAQEAQPLNYTWALVLAYLVRGVARSGRRAPKGACWDIRLGLPSRGAGRNYYRHHCRHRLPRMGETEAGGNLSPPPPRRGKRMKGMDRP